jgi:hypothetical protein
MLWLAGALTAGAYHAAAAPVTARTAQAAAASRTRLGGRLPIRF